MFVRFRMSIDSFRLPSVFVQVIWKMITRIQAQVETDRISSLTPPSLPRVGDTKEGVPGKLGAWLGQSFRARCVQLSKPESGKARERAGQMDNCF